MLETTPSTRVRSRRSDQRDDGRFRHWLATAPDAWWTLFSLGLATAFVAVTIGPALFGRGVLIDVGLLTQFMPWRADGLDTQAIWCRGDTIDGVMPQISEIRAGLRNGDLATWSPYTIGGAPLGALPHTGFLNPVSWPYFVLPLWLAPAFVKLGQFVVGIAGMALFLRRLGVRTGSAVLGGVVFVATGFMVMWSNWPQVVTACFIPLVFWALDRVAVERRARDVVLLAVAVSCMLLGGFPVVTLYTLTLGGIYVLVRAVQVSRATEAAWVRRAVTAVAGAGLGVVLGAGLAAVQLVPFVRNLGALGLDERASGGAGPIGQFLTVLAPTVHGNCVGGDYHGPMNPIEGIAFVGAGALVLAVCAVVVRTTGTGPRTPAVLAASCAVVAGLLFYGGPALEALQSLPFFSSNSIARARSVFGFLAAALAAFGIDRLLSRSRRTGTDGDDPPPRSHLHTAMAVAVVLGVGGVVLAAFVDARNQASSDGRLDLFNDALIWPGVVLGVSVLAVAAALVLPRRWRVVGPILLALAVVAQSTVFVRTLLPTSDREDFYPATAAHRFLGEHLGHDRYAGGGSWAYPPTSEYYRLSTPFGHGFHASTWMDLLTKIGPDAALTRTYSTFPASVETKDVGRQPVLDQLGVRYFAAPPGEVVGAIPAPDRPARSKVALSDTPARCEISGGPLRGIEMHVARALRVPSDRRPRVHVRLTTASGEVREGERALAGRLPKGHSLRVAVVGEDLRADGPTQVEIWTSGMSRPLRVTGTSSGPACSPIRPRDDGLSLVFAGPGAVIYERETSLPRIRWAGTSEVVPEPEDRVVMLGAGLPADTVLLDSEGPRATGSTAELEVVGDEPEKITVDVDADGTGYLLVADSIARAGWSATIDGQPVDIVPGNHALAAVPVGAGEHRVVLTYTAPGLRTGAYVTAASALVAAGLLALPLLTRRRRDETRLSAAPDEAAGSPPAP